MNLAMHNISIKTVKKVHKPSNSNGNLPGVLCCSRLSLHGSALYGLFTC